MRIRRGSHIASITVAAIALLLGGAGVAWWAVGDLTESGVRDPNRMFTAPDWATQHPCALAVVGAVLLMAGFVGFGLVVTGRSAVRTRALVVAGLLMADGLLIGFVLRLLTIGAEGASFTGLTLFVIVPPVMVVTALLMWASVRLARATN